MITIHILLAEFPVCLKFRLPAGTDFFFLFSLCFRSGKMGWILALRISGKDSMLRRKELKFLLFSFLCLSQNSSFLCTFAAERGIQPLPVNEKTRAYILFLFLSFYTHTSFTLPPMGKGKLRLDTKTYLV